MDEDRVMACRNGNYSAFYVSEPFCGSNLGAAAAKDLSYNMLLGVESERK